MDIQRPSNRRRARKLSELRYVTVAVLACAGVTLRCPRLKPRGASSTARPSAGHGERGPMLREVRAWARLFPKISLDPAQTAGAWTKLLSGRDIWLRRIP